MSQDFYIVYFHRRELAKLTQMMETIYESDPESFLEDESEPDFIRYLRDKLHGILNQPFSDEGPSKAPIWLDTDELSTFLGMLEEEKLKIAQTWEQPGEALERISNTIEKFRRALRELDGFDPEDLPF